MPALSLLSHSPSSRYSERRSASSFFPHIDSASRESHTLRESQMGFSSSLTKPTNVACHNHCYIHGRTPGLPCHRSILGITNQIHQRPRIASGPLPVKPITIAHRVAHQAWSPPEPDPIPATGYLPRDRRLFFCEKPILCRDRQRLLFGDGFSDSAPA